MTDFIMPRTSGIEAVKSIHYFITQYNNSNPEAQIKHPVVAFLTAYHTSELDQQLEDLPIQASVYEKPITLA